MNTLLLTQDLQAAGKLTQVLKQQNIGVVICHDTSDASRHLHKAKYHALFLDCDAPNASELLDILKTSGSNKTAVVLALSGDSTPVQNCGLHTRAQFVLQKPLAKSQIEKTLRAARGLLLRELRQYYRLPLNSPVIVGISGRTLQATTTNISLGGVGIRTAEWLKPATMVHLRMHLPDGELFETLAEVIWADEQGRAGIHFRDPAPLFQTRLEQWLTLEVDKQLIPADGPQLA